MSIEPRLVQIVAFEGFQLLDLAGPVDVFNAATVLSGRPLYNVEIVASRAGSVRALSGVEVTATARVGESPIPADTVLVTGGLAFGPAVGQPDLIEGIKKAAWGARRVTAVCAGAFFLAEAGLLRGRTVTTHWAGGTGLAQQYPDLRVEPDRIYIQDGRIWTSAGVTAGIDLAIALVTADHGADLAREIARWLVVYLQRPGGQNQFSTPAVAVSPRSEPLRGLPQRIEENLSADLSLESLATQVGMSTRNFSRVFAAEFGVTPARYVEQARLTAARRLLETTDMPLDRVAIAVGLRRPETLYRTFQRLLGVAPGEYRERFARPYTAGLG